MTFDPNAQRPPTRRMDAVGPEEGATAPGPEYPAMPPSYAPYAAHDDPGAAAPAAAQPVRSDRGRTAVLSLLVLLAVVILAAVAAWVFWPKSDDSGGAATPVPSTSRAPTTTESPTTSSAPTTTTTTSTPSTTVPAGQVLYQITGDGDVVNLRYRDGNQSVLTVIAGAPWKQAATVRGGVAEVSAWVTYGRVTCTIMRGDQQLVTSTAGPLTQLTCRARLTD